MKHIAVVLAFLLSTLAIAQKPQKATLDKATVYLQGAHLYYTESIQLTPGTHDFVFENISPQINEASMQASCKGAVVMDVRHEIKYKEKAPVNRKYDKEIALVLDSLDDINYEEKRINNHLKVLTTEKNMLLNNPTIKGQSTKDSLPLLGSAMAFVEDKLTALYEKELNWERAKAKVEKKKVLLNARYNLLIQLQRGEVNENNDNEQPTHQVIVTVFSETTAAVSLNFNYFINNANWVPAYDLQATSATGKLQIRYFASVRQNSGLDWKNTSLTLSTSTPFENHIKPELNPWQLSFIDYMKRNNAPASISNSAIELKKETLSYNWDMGEENTMDEKSIADYITMSENLLRVEYEIKLKYTINSDDKAHKVLINEMDAPMTLQFATVPKLSTDGFLMGRITGWEDMNIIPGNARINFDGTYVGEMFLDPSTTYDTLDINLGRDKGFSVTRKKIKEKHKDKFLENDKVETRSIEIVVRNTKNTDIEVKVEDQIPVAVGTNEIKVTLKDGDGAELDEATGQLTWHLKLNPKQSKKLVFTYEIRYPKDKPVAGL